MSRSRIIDTASIRDVVHHVEALEYLARAQVHAGVDESVVKTVRKLVVDDLNDALRAIVAPRPAPVVGDGSTAAKPTGTFVAVTGTEPPPVPPEAPAL